MAVYSSELQNPFAAVPRRSKANFGIRQMENVALLGNDPITSVSAEIPPLSPPMTFHDIRPRVACPTAIFAC